MTAYLGASFTLLLAFAILITYHYIADLRAENKRLRDEPHFHVEGWDNTHNAISNPDMGHSTEGYAGDPSKQPFPLSGIGISAIRDREFRKQQQQKEDTQPRFDKSTLAKPTESEIIAAAKKATDSVN